jgi:hypothetical protein
LAKEPQVGIALRIFKSGAMGFEIEKRQARIQNSKQVEIFSWNEVNSVGRKVP